MQLKRTLFDKGKAINQNCLPAWRDLLKCTWTLDSAMKYIQNRWLVTMETLSMYAITFNTRYHRWELTLVHDKLHVLTWFKRHTCTLYINLEQWAIAHIYPFKIFTRLQHILLLFQTYKTFISSKQFLCLSSKRSKGKCEVADEAIQNRANYWSIERKERCKWIKRVKKRTSHWLRCWFARGGWSLIPLGGYHEMIDSWDCETLFMSRSHLRKTGSHLFIMSLKGCVNNINIWNVGMLTSNRHPCTQEKNLNQATKDTHNAHVCDYLYIPHNYFFIRLVFQGFKKIIPL